MHVGSVVFTQKWNMFDAHCRVPSVSLVIIFCHRCNELTEVIWPFARKWMKLKSTEYFEDRISYSALIMWQKQDVRIVFRWRKDHLCFWKWFVSPLSIFSRCWSRSNQRQFTSKPCIKPTSQFTTHPRSSWHTGKQLAFVFMGLTNWKVINVAATKSTG